MKKLHNSTHPISLIRPIRPIFITILAAVALMISHPVLAALTYPIVDTGQTQCYSNTGAMTSPAEGAAFHGQDAQYDGMQPAYQNNGDGTITDLITGLMWQQDPGGKMTWDEADAGAASFNLAGYTDWRLPTIKELYSLIDFDGVTGMSAAASTPYIDTDYFVFEYGDELAGERFIDSQYATATKYVSTTMNGDETDFGVNFADGRIKGYGLTDPGGGGDKTFFVLYVRDNTDYGLNAFGDNADGTITDIATGLMWMQTDSGAFGVGDDSDGALNWEQALAWAENLEHAGHSDWRLPNVKELQSIVDYSRSPDTTSSAAIDPLFTTSTITDEGGGTNYPFYWSSTTHLDGVTLGPMASYVAFGEALGFMEMPPDSGSYTLLDVHGAGAQRSDPKSGNPDDYPYGFGPQGDVRRIYNFVRCVRNADLTPDNDRDNDGLTNDEEAALGTDPDNPDSDSDGLSDRAEVGADATYNVGVDTDPLLADTDGDGASDGFETTLGTDPLNRDDSPELSACGPAGIISLITLMLMAALCTSGVPGTRKALLPARLASVRTATPAQ